MIVTVKGFIPQLRTTDLDGSIRFYVDTLGFRLEFRYEDFYAGVSVGDQSLHLKLVDDEDPSIPYVARHGHLHLFFLVDDADAEAQRLENSGVAFDAEVADTAWGTREFYIRDDQGHVLCFAQAGEA